MTTAQILARARAKLLEESTTILTDATLYLYANEAQLDIARRTFMESEVQSASVVFTSGTGTRPATFGTMYGDPLDADGNAYSEVAQNDFDRAGDDTRLITVESSTLKIKPADSKTLTVRFWPTYADLAEGVNPTINAYFHELIVYGILYRAYEDLQDEELGKYYRDKYESEFTLKRDAQSAYEENNLRGGQMFNGISII